MRHTTFSLRIAALGVIVIGLLFIASTTRAQTGGGYDLTWSTLDGGGITASTSGHYELSGTFGQPDASTLSSATYTVAGGFWVDGVVLNYRLYLPLLLK